MNNDFKFIKGKGIVCFYFAVLGLFTVISKDRLIEMLKNLICLLENNTDAEAKAAIKMAMEGIIYDIEAKEKRNNMDA